MNGFLPPKNRKRVLYTKDKTDLRSCQELHFSNPWVSEIISEWLLKLTTTPGNTATECSLNITSLLSPPGLTPLLLVATPRQSSASAVTIATPLSPGSHTAMPSDLWRGDLWPWGHQTGSGGRLLPEDSESTSMIGYHLPFLYPHLCNWHIDKLALLHIVSSTVSSVHRMKRSVEDEDTYVPGHFI